MVDCCTRAYAGEGGICGNQAAPGQAWCKECFAKYKREYWKLSKERRDRQQFCLGARAMRESIVAQLRNLGSNDLNGFAAANLSERMEIPHVTE